MTDPDSTYAARAAVEAFGAAWRASRWDDLAALLHDRAVFVLPGFAGRLEGRAACVDSFRQFAAAARVLEYAESDLAVDAFAGTAVATYRYAMTWELDGARDREEGHDLLVLTRAAAGWQVAWRTLLPAAAPRP